MGKLHQEELKAALWRERQLWNKVAELEDGTGKEQGIQDSFVDDFHLKMRATYTDLAIRPDAAKVIGSLRKALESIQECEEQLRKRVEQLEPNSATTSASGTSRKRTCSRRRQELAAKSTPPANGQQKELDISAVGENDTEEF
jgi:hypothetical protein